MYHLQRVAAFPPAFDDLERNLLILYRGPSTPPPRATPPNAATVNPPSPTCSEPPSASNSNSSPSLEH